MDLSYQMEHHESVESFSALDFFHNERWPNELKFLVLQNLAPQDLIICRVVSKIWQYNLSNDLYWKNRIPSTLSNYLEEYKGRYYKIFIRGGVHLIQTLNQLKTYYNDELRGLRNLYYLTKVPFDPVANLGFLCVQTKMAHYYAENVQDICLFMNRILTFDCPYLAIPTKYFEDNEYFYLIFDNQIEDYDKCIKSMRPEEYNEKFIIKLIRQGLHAMKYLHERDLTMFTRFGTIGLGAKRLHNGEIRMQFVNYTHNLYALYAPIVYPGFYLSPDMIGDEPSITSEADVFSFGILTKFLLTGSFLYDCHPLRLFIELKKFASYEIQYPNNEVSDLAKDFISRHLKADPKDRITIEEALNHPWLTNPDPSTTPLVTAYEVHADIEKDEDNDETN